MQLSDRQIDRQVGLHRIVLDEYHPEERLQSATYDLTLHNVFLRYRFTEEDVEMFRLAHEGKGSAAPGDFNSLPILDPRHPRTAAEELEAFIVPDGECHLLYPGEGVLGITAEWIELPNDIAGRLEGKSTIGRQFVTTHITAGFVDPGWKGRLTKEIVNLNDRRIIALVPGRAFSQISFTQLTGPARRPYGSPGLDSHYQGSESVEGPRVLPGYRELIEKVAPRVS